MKNRNRCVDLVYEFDKEKLFNLRSYAYKKQYGPDVDVSALHWNSWDDRFINLGVFDGENLISLLRVAHIKDVLEYEKIMLFDFDSTALTLPVVILSRAATAEGWISSGLHSLLRLHALRIAKASGAKWVTGTFKKDTQRLQQLKDMGYEISENPVPWQSFLKSHESTLVATLNLDTHYDRAESRLIKKVSTLELDFPAVFNFDELVKRMLCA